MKDSQLLANINISHFHLTINCKSYIEILKRKKKTNKKNKKTNNCTRRNVQSIEKKEKKNPIFTNNWNYVFTKLKFLIPCNELH